MIDIAREIASRTTVLMLVDGLARDAAEARAIEEVARETKTNIAMLPPRPRSPDAAPNPNRFDAEWVWNKLMAPVRLLKRPSPASSPPRTRSARASVPAPSDDPAPQPPTGSAGPLLYVSGERTPVFIDGEFEADPRYRDPATLNWRAETR